MKTIARGDKEGRKRKVRLIGRGKCLTMVITDTDEIKVSINRLGRKCSHTETLDITEEDGKTYEAFDEQFKDCDGFALFDVEKDQRNQLYLLKTYVPGSKPVYSLSFYDMREAKGAIGLKTRLEGHNDCNDLLRNAIDAICGIEKKKNRPRLYSLIRIHHQKNVANSEQK